MNIREALEAARTAVRTGESLPAAAVEQLLSERTVMHELYADSLRLLIEERRISDRIDDMAFRMEGVAAPSPPEGPAARVSSEGLDEFRASTVEILALWVEPGRNVVGPLARGIVLNARRLLLGHVDTGQALYEEDSHEDYPDSGAVRGIQ